MSPQGRRPRQDPYEFANFAAAFQAGRLAHSEDTTAHDAPEEDPEQFTVNEGGSDERLAFFYSPSPNSRAPILDSGASAHLFPSNESFRNATPVNIPITVANGSTIAATTRGDTFLRTGHTLLALPSALHVPGLTTALVSAAKIAKKYSVTFYPNNFFISQSFNIPPAYTVIATGSRRNNIF